MMNHRLVKSLWLFLRIVVALSGILLLVPLVQYINCPVYEFKEGEPFAGNRLFNPYEGMSPDAWKKGNFQVQSYAWGGITAGWNNSNEMIWDLYGSLGYDIVGISDYQKINRFGAGRPGYLPIYEHGFNIRKVHQVVIGANTVLWLDFPLWQNRHHKQRVIEKLEEEGVLVTLAHPLLRKGYSPDDMRILAGYDGIEVISGTWTSMEHWDAALSAGNYVTILSNDDAHDVSNPDEVGNRCTFVNTPTLTEPDIMSALRVGRSYGVSIGWKAGESMADKITRTARLPMLTRHELRHDTLFVSCDSPARFIRFIGQGGEGLQTDYGTSEASYVFRADDPYIRAEIHFDDGTALYMNPVCRHDGNGPAKAPLPAIDVRRTRIQRIAGFSVLLGTTIMLVFMTRVRRKKKLSAGGHS